MARCNYCFNITTKQDVVCYVCGERLEGVTWWQSFRRSLVDSKPQPKKVQASAEVRRLNDAAVISKTKSGK